jgi:hypothetical protein
MVRGFADRVKLAGQVFVSESLRRSRYRSKVTLLLRAKRLTNVRKEAGMSRAASSVELTRLTEAKSAIDRQPNIRGIALVLSVVLPPADRTQNHGAGSVQSLAPTTWTAKTSLCGFRRTFCNFPHARMDGNRTCEFTWPKKNRCRKIGDPSMAIARLLRGVIKELAMKPETALFLLLAFAPSARALHLEPVRNDTGMPLPVVDIENEDRKTVAQLFVMPGETMKLDSSQSPAAGAGYYAALPGEEYYILIPAKFRLPRMGKDVCPCALHVQKVEWNRAGEVTSITGFRPFLETAIGTKIPIVSDVAHPKTANGKLYFKLKDHGSGEYWIQIRYAQVVDAGGPWGSWEMARFLLLDVLPLMLAGLLAFCVVGAIRLLREESHPEKSFIELMQLSLRSLDFRKMGVETEPAE